jgi:ClpP class serine protease
VASTAQGVIYTGLGGLRNGLVDEIGGLWDAIVLAKEAAGLSPSASIALLEGPDLGNLSMDLFKPSLIRTRLSDVDELATSGATAPVEAEAAVWLSERPGFFSSIFSVEQWAAMSTVERAWLRQVFLTPRQPITMIEPMNLGNWMPPGMW